MVYTSSAFHGGTQCCKPLYGMSTGHDTNAALSAVGSGTGAVVCRMPLGCVRRFQLRARLGVPSLRLRPPPHRTGQADFPHPAHREGVFHRGYASVQLGLAFALQYITR
jgi:hypothetical protein